jgi:hypothetical protein
MVLAEEGRLPLHVSASGNAGVHQLAGQVLDGLESSVKIKVAAS